MVVKLGPGVSEQSHKNYIFMASPFDLPAEDDASGLGVEYDIEKDYGIVGGGSGDVETFIKTGEIQLMINEMAQGIFEGAGENLLGKMNGNEFVLG